MVNLTRNAHVVEANAQTPAKSLALIGSAEATHEIPVAGSTVPAEALSIAGT